MAHLHLEKFVKSKYYKVCINSHTNVVSNSTFGLAFEEAAEKTNCRISLDSFEASVVQVRNDDIEHFVETLYYKSR